MSVIYSGDHVADRRYKVNQQVLKLNLLSSRFTLYLFEKKEQPEALIYYVVTKAKGSKSGFLKHLLPAKCTFPIRFLGCVPAPGHFAGKSD